MALNNIRTISVKLGADVTSFVQNINNAKKEFSSLSSESRNLMSRITAQTQLAISQLGNYASSNQKAAIEASGLSQKLQVQRASLEKMNNELLEVRQKFGEASPEAKRFELQLLRATKAEQDMANKLAKLNEQLSMTSKMSQVGEKLRGFGQTLSIGLTAPFLFFSKQAVEASAKAEETANLFQVSFGNMSKEAEAWAQSMAKAYKLNPTNLKESASTLNLILQTMGATQQQAEKMATSLTTRAIDISSLRNIDFKTAFEKIQSGLTGESEPLMRVGINVKEDYVKKLLESKGIATQNLTELQKVYGRYLAILQQTTKDQGDFGRTMDSTTNRARIFKEQLSVLKETAGNTLKSAFDKILATLTPLIEKFNNLSAAKQRFIIIAASLVTAIGPVTMAFGYMTMGISAAITNVAKFIKFLRELSMASVIAAGKIVLVTLAALALAAVAVVVWRNWEVVKQWFAAFWDSTKAGFSELGAYISLQFWNATGSIMEAIDKIQNGMSKLPGMSKLYVGVSDATKQAYREQQAATKELYAAGKLADESRAKLKSITQDTFNKIAKQTSSDISKAKESFLGAIGTDGLDTKGLTTSADGVKEAADKTTNELRQFVDKVKSQAKSFADAFNLFDKPVEQRMSGAKLMTFMKKQVKIFEGWAANMRALGARLGTDSPLYQELLSQGVKSSGQVKSLSKFSDAQLNSYNELYGRKNAIAYEFGGIAAGAEIKKDKKVEQIVIQITNAYGDGVDELTDKICKKLKLAGVY